MAYPRVEIIGEHPWSGFTGRCTGKIAAWKHWSGAEMYEIRLDEGQECEPGHECFAEKKHLRLIESGKDA